MHDLLNFAAFSVVEQAAAPVYTMIDDFIALFAEHEHSQGDVPSRLKAMRRSHASSLQLLQRLQELQRIMCGRIEQFTQRVERFDSRISCIALNYGLNLLPDEVLSEIFVLASTTLKEKVALTLVCRRFRSVMMSMQKLWNGYWIRSDQTPEENVAIAEANNFVSLKACIKSPHYLSDDVETDDEETDDVETDDAESSVLECVLDPTKHRVRYYKFCVGLILSFGPEELKFDCLTESEWEEIEPILAGGNMQNLRRLVMLRVSRNSVGARLLGRWHMPLLRSLELDFVPAPALGRNLIQFALNSPSSTIGEVEIDSLREFLAATSSLQDLRLFFPKHTPRSYEVCDLPSLRSLEVNFAPHPSLAGHLIRFQIYLRMYCFSELLAFLSLSEALQELVIDGSFSFSEGPGTTDALPIVNMPSLVSCDIRSYSSGATLIAKLRMPILRTLKLRTLKLGALALSMVTRNEFSTSLRSMASLEVLELKYAVDDVFGDVVELLRYAPLHLDSLSLKGCHIFANEEGLNATPMPRRKLISFMGCGGNFLEYMPTLVNYLRAVDLGGMRIQMSGCKGCRDGTFGLDEVMSSFIVL